MSTAERILLGMIQDNAEQAIEMAELGHFTTAKEHFETAIQQIDQLAEVAAQEAAKPKPKQIPLIDIN